MVNTEETLAKTRKVFGILVPIFGLLFLTAVSAVIVSLYFVNDLLANSTRVDGQVVALEPGAKGALAPVVEFKSADGETLKLKSFMSVSPAPQVGDTVKVIYRTSNPQDWRIDNWMQLYFWTFMSSIFAISWGIAFGATKLAGDFQIRKLVKASGGGIQ